MDKYKNKMRLPKCGSNLKNVHLEMNDSMSLNIHESFNGKIKDKNFNSKKNPRYEFVEGDDLRKCDGRWDEKKQSH